MTTRDTPEAALATAIKKCRWSQFMVLREAGDGWEPVSDNEAAAAILAAMPDWTLVPTNSDSTIEHIEWQRATIARLRAALQSIADFSTEPEAIMAADALVLDAFLWVCIWTLLNVIAPRLV